MSCNRPADAGDTLIELLVTIVVLTVGVLAVATAMGGASTMSAVHRKQVDADAFVRAYAEAVRSETYSSCSASTTPSYTTPAGLFPSGSEFSADPTVPAVEYWTGSTWSTSCPSSGDPGLQRVRVGVRHNDARVGKAELSVVLRRAAP